MKNKKFIVAVDGASSTGKSTICKLIAQKHNFAYIETGAIYRSVALLVKERSICLEHSETLELICKYLDLNFEIVDGINKIKMDGRDVSDLIRTPEISMLSSHVSAIPVVRSNLLDMQRKLAINTLKEGAILDGRDIGTIVFPKANLKIFLTASNETKAKRRYAELLEKAYKVTYEDVFKDMVLRDGRDSNRDLAPLVKAKDALEINTDNLSIEEVYNLISNKINELINVKF